MDRRRGREVNQVAVATSQGLLVVSLTWVSPPRSPTYWSQWSETDVDSGLLAEVCLTVFPYVHDASSIA